MAVFLVSGLLMGSILSFPVVDIAFNIARARTMV
jgi:hypothetical protein